METSWGREMRLYETDDFYPLGVLFKACGLEVKPEEKPEGIVKMWRVDDEDGELIAAATAQVLNGIYVAKHLAVTEACRGKYIGKKLLNLIEEELIGRGAKEMWLAGKVPEYYIKFGWETVPAEEAPPFSKCLVCKQFNNGCYPSIMRKRV